MKFVIPASPNEADDLSAELGEIATAAEWKRAALVYARVRVTANGGDRRSEATRRKSESGQDDGKITADEYALRGIHGLRSGNTVRRYWHAWDNAITEGLAEPVSLGDEVELPDAEWADYYTPVNPATSPLLLEDEPPAEQIIDSDLSSFESGSYLGQGNCPPMASDLDKGEQDSRGERLRDMFANSRADEEGSESLCNKFAARICDIHLEAIQRWAKSALERIDPIERTEGVEAEQAEEMLERIESIRATLTSIELVLRGESIGVDE